MRRCVVSVNDVDRRSIRACFFIILNSGKTLNVYGMRNQRRIAHISLRADVSYFLCFTRKRDVCAGVCVTPFLIVFQYPAVSPEFGDRALIGFLTVGIVRINSDWLSSRNTQGNLCGINSARFSIDRSKQRA